MTSVLRPPGRYAVIDGAELRTRVVGDDYVLVPGEDGDVRYEMDQLDDLLSVGVRARWRGGDVVVDKVDGDQVGFYSDDRALIEREGLFGDARDGWYGTAPLSELTDVTEIVASIHPRRRDA